MHGATPDAPPQVYTFPRRPPNAETAKGGESSERGADTAAGADGGETSVDEAGPPSSERNDGDDGCSNGDGSGSSDDISLDAVSGSHAGSDRAVSWSVADAAG